jgi:uncharacterized membrane protein YphA (DoxX/SURF4 family)
MKFSFLPKTKLGKWAVVLFLLAVLLIALFFVLTGVFNQKGGATFFSNLSLTIPMLLAWVFGLCSFILGLIAVIKNKSRAFLVFVSMILGFVITLFGIFALTPG